MKKIKNFSIISITLLSIIVAVSLAFMGNKIKSSPKDLKEDKKYQDSDLIKIYNPLPDQVVRSPLETAGEARGYWFFEASFPVRIYDASGLELGVFVAQAQPDPITGEINWMTEDFVPFSVVMDFKKPATVNGEVVFQKDNPSGLPEYDAEIRIPVKFDLNNWPEDRSEESCLITGCSGQICGEEEAVTTCEFLPEYACYASARCERQNDGQCGWTMTEELLGCLDNKID